MCSKTEVTVGLSISLTGRFCLQGQQALQGMRLWQSYINAQGGIALRNGERRSVPQITISVYNDARIPEQFLAEAIEQASRIFLKAGLQTRWLDCSLPAIGIQRDADCKAPFGPAHMALRIVHGSWMN